MRYQYAVADGLKIFYRECGDPEKPAMVLFHGFPSSSHMFRDLMPMLEDRFHLIAPDYPGFGQSESPDRASFAYTFDHLAEVMDAFLVALHLDRFYMYVFDYGAPIGFRIARKHPERILGIVSQNGSVIIEYHAILHLCRSVFLNLQPYRCDLLSTQRDSAKHSAKVFCCNLSM